MVNKLLNISYYRVVLFSISGLTFWFLLGFPFANYHESYEWIARVQIIPALDLIFSYVGHYASYRPLGQFLAISLYKIFNSMAAIQTFNYLISISAVIFILKPNSEKTLSLPAIFFLIGSIFFPAFSYLFHLHGFFYSPLALMIGILYYFSLHEFSFNTILKTFYITCIAALFHPFAIIIFFAFLTGWSLENRNSINRKIIISDTFLISALIVLYVLLVDKPFSYLTWENLFGIFNVLAALESKLPMLLLSFLLSIVTVYSIRVLPKTKYVLLSLSLLLSVLFVFFKIPLIFLLIIICLAKLIYNRKWSLVFLISILILFPLFSGTISKHLKFLILFVLPAAIAMDINGIYQKMHYLYGKILMAVPALLFIILILLRLNLQLPVVSQIAYPLLVEKEKSFQLENAIDWIRNSEYKNYSIEFVPSNNNDKFPASSANINTYLGYLNSNAADHSSLLSICFDCDSLSNKKIIYSASGLYSKNIHIFLP